MTEKKAKYINFGSINKFANDDRMKLAFDGAYLKDLIQYLNAYGEKYLKGLSKADIWAAHKLDKEDPNYIPRLISSSTFPNDNAPGFIEYNVYFKVENDAEIPF